MGKKKKERTNKKFAAKVNLQELQESRNGGQAALRGYSYQFLYSCNLILSSDADTVFILEGIEDVDGLWLRTIESKKNNQQISGLVV